MTKVAQADIHIRGKDKTKNAFNSVQGRLMRLKGSLTSLHGAMGLVIGGGFIAMGKKALESADNIGKFADRAGVTTAELQKMRYAFDLAGVGVEAVDKALLTFGKRLGKARMGIGALEGGLKNGEEALLAKLKATNNTTEAMNLMFEAMGNAETQTRKLAIADAGFGMAGLRMTAGFRDGAEAFKEAKNQAEKLGMVLDEKLIRSAEATNDKITTVASVLKTKMMAVFIKLAPLVDKVANGLLAIVSIASPTQNLTGEIDKLKSKIAEVNKQITFLEENGKAGIFGQDNAKTIQFLRDKVKGLTKDLKELQNTANIGTMTKTIDPTAMGGFNRLRSTPFNWNKSDTRISLGGSGAIFPSAKLKESTKKSIKVPGPVEGDFIRQDKLENRVTLEYERQITVLAKRQKGEEKLIRFLEDKWKIEDRIGRDLTTMEETKLHRVLEVQTQLEKQIMFQQEIANTAERVFDRAGDGLVLAMQRGEGAMEAFGNVARAVLFDVQRELIKLAFFEPLKKAIFGFGADMFSGFNFGGGKASGGLVQAGKSFLVGEKGPELFSPSSSGHITPNNQLDGGGVNVTLNFSTGIQSTVRAEVMGLMPIISQNVKLAVSEARLRGGSFSKAMGV